MLMGNEEFYAKEFLDVLKSNNDVLSYTLMYDECISEGE